MSVFSELMGDIGGQASRGFAGGAIDDFQRQNALKYQLKAYQGLLPMRMQEAEHAAQLRAKAQTQHEDAALRRALMLEAYKRSMDPKAQAQPNLLALLGQKVEVPQDPAVMPASPRTPEYGAGEEAMSGMVPATRTVRGEHALLGMFGMDPNEREVVPHISAKGDVSASFQRTPKDTSSRAIESLSSPYAIAARALGVEPGKSPSPAEAERIFQKVEQHSKSKSPTIRNDIYNQVMVETGNPALAQQAVADYEKLIQRYGATGRTLGAYGPEVRPERVETAKETAAGSIRGRTAAELEPIPSPVTGTPAARVTVLKQAQAAGENLPASERKALSEFTLLNELADSVERDSKGFSAPFFGPVTGRYGLVRERITGQMGEEEVAVRRNLGDIKDTLLRARSGAQINEQEYNRLARLVPDITDPANVAKAKMKSFRQAVKIVSEERQRLQGITGGAIAPKASRTPVQAPVQPKALDLSKIPPPPRPEIPRRLKANGQLLYWDGTQWQNPR